MHRGLYADYLVTAAGTVSAPGWLVVDERGAVVAVGRGERPTGPAWEAAPRGSLIAPGFINAHAHLALGRARGVADDLGFLEWIRRGLLPELRDRAVDPDYFAAGARESVSLLLASGVTAVGENFFRPDGADALRTAGLRGVFFQEVFGSAAPDEDAHLREIDAVAEGLPQRLAGFPFGYSPHTPWTCPRRAFAHTAARAAAEGRRLSYHLAESAEEHDFFAERRGPLYESFAAEGRLGRYLLGRSPAAAVEDLGGLGPHVLVAHGVHLTDDDVARLARTGTSLVHCPLSNAKLAEGTAPIADLLAAGVNVALGTDSAASNARLDFFEEMRAALLFGRAARRAIGPFTARTALAMATLRGARALGFDGVAGELAPGYAADFVVVDVSTFRHGPVRDAIETLVWTCERADVRRVVVGGVVRYDAAEIGR
jgi:5-methylthioadenosine/S-adenosylhomocysteine deaminase